LKGLEVFKDNPLFGIGFDRYVTKWTSELDNYNIMMKYNIRFFNTQGNVTLNTTDSFLAKILPEMGLVGGGLFVILIAVVLKKSYKLTKLNSQFSLFFYTLMYLLFYTINQSHSLFNRQMGPMFWICMGFVIKYYYQLIQNRQNQIDSNNKESRLNLKVEKL
jgi:O-antigen ligase